MIERRQISKSDDLEKVRSGDALRPGEGSAELRETAWREIARARTAPDVAYVSAQAPSQGELSKADFASLKIEMLSQGNNPQMRGQRAELVRETLRGLSAEELRQVEALFLKTQGRTLEEAWPEAKVRELREGLRKGVLVEELKKEPFDVQSFRKLVAENPTLLFGATLEKDAKLFVAFRSAVAKLPPEERALLDALGKEIANNQRFLESAKQEVDRVRDGAARMGGEPGLHQSPELQYPTGFEVNTPAASYFKKRYETQAGEREKLAEIAARFAEAGGDPVKLKAIKASLDEFGTNSLKALNQQSAEQGRFAEGETLLRQRGNPFRIRETNELAFRVSDGSTTLEFKANPQTGKFEYRSGDGSGPWIALDTPGIGKLPPEINALPPDMRDTVTRIMNLNTPVP